MAVIAGAEAAGSPVVLQVGENAVKFRLGSLLPPARAATAAAEREVTRIIAALTGGTTRA